MATPFISCRRRVHVLYHTYCNFCFPTVSKNKIIISSNNPEVGQAEETIASTIEGPEINISFNAQYMLDVLKIINDENIIMSMNYPALLLKIYLVIHMFLKLQYIFRVLYSYIFVE